MKDRRKDFVRRRFYDYNSSAGFTLIETLVVLGILAMLASILITYNGSARQQDALTIETNKIGQVINLAKSLAMSTYGSGGKFCGYGVYFNINENSDYINSSSNICGKGIDYCIFHYPLPSGDQSCDQVSGFNGITLDNVVAGYVYAMDKSVKFNNTNSASNLQSVLFVPPQPEVFLSGVNGELTGSGTINLISGDGKSSSVITVSPAGQISFN